MKLLIFDIQRFENISNNTDNRIVTGTADADSIFASGNNVTINALGSNDTIMSYAQNSATLSGGEGDDSLFSNAV